MGFEAGLPRRSSLLPTLAWTFSGAIGNVSRLAARRRSGIHPGRHRLHSAFLLDGACAGRALRSLWQPAMDSGHVLRNWRGGNRDHRPKRHQACTGNGGKRLAAVGDLRCPGDLFISGLHPLLAGIHGLAPLATVGVLFLFFLKAGAFVFGSGLAIVPFLYGGVVTKFHWLTERQFVDAVAVAMITPGPVVITAAFIGYLVAGPVGAVVAALAVFAPPYLIVVLGAPYYRRFAQNPQVKAFVQGVTAAAVGAIAGAAYILARRSLVDTPTVIIGLTTLAILMFTKRVPEPIVILAAGAVGVVLHGKVG